MFMAAYPTRRALRDDTRMVLRREFSAKTIRLMIPISNTPIFQLLAAERFARPE